MPFTDVVILYADQIPLSLPASAAGKLLRFRGIGAGGGGERAANGFSGGGGGYIEGDIDTSVITDELYVTVNAGDGTQIGSGGGTTPFFTATAAEDADGGVGSDTGFPGTSTIVQGTGGNGERSDDTFGSGGGSAACPLGDGRLGNVPAGDAGVGALTEDFSSPVDLTDGIGATRIYAGNGGDGQGASLPGKNGHNYGGGAGNDFTNETIGGAPVAVILWTVPAAGASTSRLSVDSGLQLGLP